MLSLKNRLKKGKDFNRVYKKGKSVSGEGIFFKFLENGSKESRIGFSVGIKFSPKAVLRNKMKRQLRAVIREKLNILKEGVDIIIIPQAILGKETFKSIKEKIEKALIKGNLVNN